LIAGVVASAHGGFLNQTSDPYQHWEDKIMSRRSIIIMMAVGVTSLCASSIARADEVLKFRMFLHATFIQNQEVGDVEGHALYVGRYSGLVSFSDGSVGTGNLTFTSDYTKGAGTFSTYFSVAPSKDSTLWIRVENGTAKPEGTTTLFPEARAIVVGGSGKFEGAKGDGTFMGVRLAPLPGVPAELWNEFVINIKK
jgi:hypothetical protein